MRLEVEVVRNQRLLDVAMASNVPGIYGSCGGGCRCCTCHCWIQAPADDQLELPSNDEKEMLAYAWGRSTQSRLACQVVVEPDMENLIVHVPARQN